MGELFLHCVTTSNPPCPDQQHMQQPWLKSILSTWSLMLNKWQPINTQECDDAFTHWRDVIMQTYQVNNSSTLCQGRGSRRWNIFFSNRLNPKLPTMFTQRALPHNANRAPRGLSSDPRSRIYVGFAPLKICYKYLDTTQTGNVLPTLSLRRAKSLPVWVRF